MLNLRVVITAVFLVILTCGCRPAASADNFQNIQKKLFELRSYKCTADIVIFTNKNKTGYKINQYYTHPGKYRVEVIYPDFLKGVVMVSNDKNVWVSNPSLTVKSTYYFDNFLNSTGNNTFLTEFFSNYVKSEKSQMAIKNKKYKLSTYISNGNTYMDTEVLTIKPDGCPESLEIFDHQANLKILLSYKEFVMNPKLDNKLFE